MFADAHVVSKQYETAAAVPYIRNFEIVRPYDTVDIGLSWTGDREGRPYTRIL